MTLHHSHVLLFWLGEDRQRGVGAFLEDEVRFDVDDALIPNDFEWVKRLCSKFPRCSFIPGENEVPSEDALVLHLQLAEGQEQLVEALRAQQGVIRELTQKLVEQQEALLSQQRAVLELQRGVYQQMGLVEAQSGLLADAVRQASLRGEELHGSLPGPLAGQQNQAGGHPQQSPAVDKAHAAPTWMDVGGEAQGLQPLPGCSSAPCGQEEYCNVQEAPPRCQKCTACPPGFFLISRCSATADSVCQVPDAPFHPSAPRQPAHRVSCVAGQGRVSGAAEGLRRAGEMPQHPG